MSHSINQHRWLLTRFFGIAAITLVALLIGGMLLQNGARATADTVSMADHPVLGTWIMNDEGQASLTSFTSDGIAIDQESDRSSGLGSWEVTGPDSARLTIAVPNITPEFFFEGTLFIRAEVVVSGDGTLMDVEYSVTGMYKDGSVVFDDFGSGTAVRFPVESMNATGNIPAGYPVPSAEATPSN